MNPLLLFILLVWGAQKAHLAEITSCFPDYYWRDFKGKIPEDAVEGGLSPSGRPFYVAQAYFPKTGLLPANVFPGKSEALSSGLGKEMKTNAHVKVLCSKHKKNFKWVPMESKDLHKLTSTHVVIGGGEIGRVLYIGRVFDETSPIVGKVFKHLHSNRGVWIPSNGGELNFLSYEILTYSCKDGPSNFPNSE
ncbi:hypothetical protein MTP99_007106 [Tenebrio molitor]|jgi:hypothetical protein|uniref:uncharacterized protein n=1 Tax=Tenebrio molitor TaxID=7067 RepID=UPI002700E4B5|nr:hypothetical protein MTP99_007103 [Tenebrio molitor]KAJ3617378.1 hypothetical protein MTP99_007106 [Tenebrio molitor]